MRRFLFLLVLVGGCASLARQTFRTPSVELKDIKVRGIGTQGGSVDLILDVFNPNDYRIDATHLSYKFYADTATRAPVDAPREVREGMLAMGDVNRRVTLERRQHNEVALPVTFTLREINGAFAVLMRRGSIDYRVAGEVTLDTPFGSLTRPYEGKARFDNAMLFPR